ncbi:MAG TPA: SAM-dependent methyltransferase [Actinocrinis sp.]|nr:SAM-dependent methyltransferase [Actinocrinis sp.]
MTGNAAEAGTPLTDYLATLADPAQLAAFRADPAGHTAQAGLSEELAALVLAGHSGALRVRAVKELEQAGLAPVVSDKFGPGGGQDPQVNYTASTYNTNYSTTNITINTSVLTTTNTTTDVTTTTDTTTTTSDTTTTTSSDGTDWGEILVEAIDRVIEYFEQLEYETAGELVVVGSGIRAITDLTLGAEAQIRAAEKVFYCVADPVTERRVHLLNPSAESLYGLYGNDTERIDTYRAMVETILAPVRAGRRVCAVYYGHPGVFAWPTHEAVRIARREGHRAEMHAAVSADAVLFADLGIDPSRPGCHSLEATDLLIRHRVPDTASHVLLWQVECVGDSGFNFAGYRRHNFEILIEELTRHYPPDHPVYIYEAAQLPQSKPHIARSTLATITKDDLSGISTLYLPPARTAPVDRAMCEQLGLGHG